MQYTYQVIFLPLIVYTIFTITLFDECAPKIIPKTALGVYDVAVVNDTCWSGSVENAKVSWFKAIPVIPKLLCLLFKSLLILIMI